MEDNNKLPDSLKEYNDKVKSGEVERTKPKNPYEKWKEKKKSLRLSVNAKCWDCCCGQRSEITNCTSEDCPLFVVRPYQRKE